MYLTPSLIGISKPNKTRTKYKLEAEDSDLCNLKTPYIDTECGLLGNYGYHR